MMCARVCLLVASLFVLFAAGSPAAGAESRSDLVYLTDGNWRQVLQGEWLIKFHAPWCPACRAMVDTWKALAQHSPAFDVRIAKADVTLSPALSGRFFITALPTILHVKDGQFQQYRGPRDLRTLSAMVEDRSWHHMDALSEWKHPDSLHMSCVAYFFQLSHMLKETSVYLQETYKMSNWVTYALFTVFTITMGAIIGLLFVCFVDYVAPPRRKSFEELQRDATQASSDLAVEDLDVDEPVKRRGAGDADDDEELDSDDDTSDGEKISNQDSSEEDDEENDDDEEADDDVEDIKEHDADVPAKKPTNDGKADLKKRKSRKAD